MPVHHPHSLRPQYPLRSERLLLRPLTIGDADALLAYRGREDVCRYVPFEPMSREDITERIAAQWARTELTDEGQALLLGVEVSETGDLVGDIMLFWHSRLHAGGELGYVFNPDSGGRGYATEAADAILRLGFEGLGLHRIIARIDERNEPSVRLARRLGMRQEARLVHNEFFKGEWSTELDFAMLAGEWHASRNGGAYSSSMNGITVGRAREADLGEILRTYERFWGDRDLPRHLHHPMFVVEFGDTAFVARRADGEIAGYLLGFVAPTRDGYIHFVAVRDDARGLGLGRRLYEAFTGAALERGAVALKAITSPQNESSITFHRKLGFEVMPVDDYGGGGRARIVMRRPLT